jgi:hypothetical protein
MELQAQQPTAQEQSVQEMPVPEQDVRGTAAAVHPGNGPQTPADKPGATTAQAAANRQSPGSPNTGRTMRRHCREVLLPQITQLALEGQTGWAAIAVKFGLPVRTVNHWLRQICSQWKTAAAQSGDDLAALALARLNGIYCQAMEAWREAHTEIQPPARTKSQATGADGPVRRCGVPPRFQKRRDAASTSTKAKRRDAASTQTKATRRWQSSDDLFGRAITAVRESLKFLEDSARATAGVPAAGAPRAEQNRRWTEGLDRMTNEELVALEASLKAQRELAGNCPKLVR